MISQVYTLLLSKNNVTLFVACLLDLQETSEFPMMNEHIKSIGGPGPGPVYLGQEV